ncbi:MAG TPA: hypothetical protein VJJ98_03185, partial [Sedimentisphaerales bacterium]|nr:hypothetical protein [Sedimentisphaerales bacterium]
ILPLLEWKKINEEVQIALFRVKIMFRQSGAKYIKTLNPIIHAQASKCFIVVFDKADHDILSDYE